MTSEKETTMTKNSFSPMSASQSRLLSASIRLVIGVLAFLLITQSGGADTVDGSSYAKVWEQGGCAQHFQISPRWQLRGQTVQSCADECKDRDCTMFFVGRDDDQTGRAGWCNMYSDTCTKNGDTTWDAFEIGACVGAPSYLGDEIEIDFVGAYDWIWTFRAHFFPVPEASFWRPTPMPGFYRVGDHVKRGVGYPEELTMTVKENVPGYLRPPTDYDKIWDDSGSGADGDVSVWRPRCPVGYSALGDVATQGYGKPSLDEIRCVPCSAVGAADLGGSIWDSASTGTDASPNFSAWSIQEPPTEDSDHALVNRGLFHGFYKNSRPEGAAVSALKTTPNDFLQKAAELVSDDLWIAYTTAFEEVWTDRGSGAHRDVGFFRPIPPPGYYAVGDYAHASHGMPDDVVMVLKEKTPGALAAPLNYEKVWSDAGSGADDDAAVWRPRCPSDYSALGLVTTSGAEPSKAAVRCVKTDLTVQAETGDAIWNDAGSGADRDFSAWHVQVGGAPPETAFVTPGSFIGHASHAKPDNRHALALRMKLPTFLATSDLPVPTLHGYGKPLAEETTTTSVVYLPFTAVKADADAWSLARRAKDSPYYRLVRTDKFSLIDHLHNATDVEQERQWRYSIAVTNSESFTHQTGISITGTIGTGSEAVVKKEVSITLSYSFTHETARSTTTTTTQIVPLKAAPRTAVAAYVVDSTFQLFRADGSAVGPKAQAKEPKSHVIVQYPPP